MEDCPMQNSSVFAKGPHLASPDKKFKLCLLLRLILSLNFIQEALDRKYLP